MIRHASVDEYVLKSMIALSAEARERMREARKRTPWFTEELFADVFYSFYLPKADFDYTQDDPPFHRWLVKTITEQHLYTSIQPRTRGAAGAAFRTALKSLMWLTAEYAAEAERRRKQQRPMRVQAEKDIPGGGSGGSQAAGSAGGGKDERGGEPMPGMGEGEEDFATMLAKSLNSAKRDRRNSSSPSSASAAHRKRSSAEQPPAELSERLNAEQLERLKAVGYKLHEGKQAAEEKQAASDARPLVEADIAALRERIEELREAMRTDFMRRDKWKKKLEKTEADLVQRRKQLERLQKAEAAQFDELDEELGKWLNGSLRQTLTEEDQETKLLDDLIAASLLFANRSWGDGLGKLRRQAYRNYLQWVERLKNHPELIAMVQAVGRHAERLIRTRRELRARLSPDRYDEVGMSADLAHILPGEAGLLADPDYEAYFMVKMLEGKLMTYRAHTPTRDLGRGPVICCLDTSHSMRGAKLRLAQVFVMTFAALTLYERRDFVLLLFGAKGELLEQPLLHRSPDWEAFYRLSQLAFGGGTHFDAPLRRGMELIRATRVFADADIVMVTDGIGAVSAPVREELAELGRSVKLRLHSLIIGSARRHLAQAYDILGVSHEVRFAAAWDAGEEGSASLLLNVMSDPPTRRAVPPAAPSENYMN